MKKKRIILSFIAVAIIGGAWFGYSEYNRKVKDLSTVKAHLTMPSKELVAAFEENEADANAQYLDKIIAVNGKVKVIEKNDRGHYTIFIADEGSMSSVRCSMDSLHVKGIEGMKEGELIIVKGACTGFNSDELLGSDVILNRCVIENNE